MISHGKEIKVFAGNSNPKLAEGICKKLNIELGKSVATAFSYGEISISINEPVRGADVFVIQSTCGPVNNNLALLHEVLVKQHEALTRWPRGMQVFGQLYGHSVFIAEGQAWRDKRRALAAGVSRLDMDHQTFE